MAEEENIAAYLQRVEEIVSTMKGLGETITQSTVVQKVLRNIPLIFNPKVSAIEDIEKLDDLTLEELHGILVAYEMRIQDPSQKEVAFKVTKEKNTTMNFVLQTTRFQMKS